MKTFQINQQGVSEKPEYILNVEKDQYQIRIMVACDEKGNWDAASQFYGPVMGFGRKPWLNGDFSSRSGAIQYEIRSLIKELINIEYKEGKKFPRWVFETLDQAYSENTQLSLF
jgi:hypothetical protein